MEVFETLLRTGILSALKASAPDCTTSAQPTQNAMVARCSGKNRAAGAGYLMIRSIRIGSFKTLENPGPIVVC